LSLDGDVPISGTVFILSIPSPAEEALAAIPWQEPALAFAVERR
jgi:hypothetical protein